MKILSELSELVDAGVISDETAGKIRIYQQSKSNGSSNRSILIFGILGALLVGLGIILIIAHNWDELPKSIKTVFAFLPLIAGQIICAFVLLRKRESTIWKESAATFLFCAVGASISLVSQIYHIPGSLSTFLISWMILCLPLIYLMNSSVVSILYLIGITYSAGEIGYWSYPASEAYSYWILLLLMLPHYYRIYSTKPGSLFMIFHNWLIPLSVIFALGTVAKSMEELLFIAYLNLFGLFYLVGNLDFFAQQKSRNNGFRVLGSLGTLVLLIVLSFDFFWIHWRKQEIEFSEMIASGNFYISLILAFCAALLLLYHHKKKTPARLKPIAYVFILSIVTFAVGYHSFISVILINLFVLAIGLWTMRTGAKQDNLGLMNYGLLIISALLTCRFFDTDLTFVMRGILFISLGVAFFLTNYLTLKKRKADE